LDSVEFGAGDGLIFEERGETLEVLLGLELERASVVESGLNIARIEFDEEIAGADVLARCGVEPFDAGADPGLDGGAGFGADGADDGFGSVDDTGVDGGDSNGDGWERFGGWRCRRRGAGDE
jgi:hypothetical protein